MEHLFLALLVIIMIGALASGFPVAFALPGSAIISIGLAAFFGYLFAGDSSAYFAVDGPKEWLTAGITNFRSNYWDVETDTLIAIPLFIFMGIMLQKSKIAEDLLVTMGQLFGPIPWRPRNISNFCWSITCSYNRYCWGNSNSNGINFTTHNA